VTVYVSLPLRGPSGADGQDAADGAELALAEAGGEAAGREVRAVVLDDTEGTGERASWTPQQAAANARQATEDSASIAYIGDFESGATRSSLPITNEARLLQVSPASAAVDLVAPFVGSDDVPDVQPSGERTFGRVIPSDDRQAAAAAHWAGRLGAARVATVSDGTQFGDGMVVAFEKALDSATVTRRDFDLLFFGGAPEREPASLTLSLGSERFMVSDAELVPGAVRAQPSGTLATSAALDPSQLPPAGQEFVGRFRSEYDRDPGRYAAYGYEAMAVVLDAIERAGDGDTDREAVIDAFLDTSDRDSILGTYSIDEVGDTTLDRLTGFQVEGDRARPVADLWVP
jgi:branched-chain amino acid transport system substrate-binding protein